MQRQLSNVSVHSYQDYQPSRKYGGQYEPGGYAAAVQQRSNMTQREDALKFEQGRIRALQEERLHIQKKTFTKWMNSFLQKARMEVEDLFVDLADGRRLLKLLEIISGERLPRPNSGRMRVHKIENVNKSLSFLHTKVRLESIGAEDIVDGNPRLILGLVWTIILRFQIQEIEIDVDEENESSEKKSAKDALLLWCQRKTSGYHGVHIHNFSDSWRSGLGFNALIHAHRPDLFRWHEVPTTDHVETLNHAFDVAHNNLGIPKLLDAEDVDTTRPDEKSVMTYVASYYHTFARMKNEQKSGRRIANIIGQLMDIDARKAQYSRLLSALLEWIRLKIEELSDRDLPNSLDGIQRLLLAFKQYRTVEKPPKYKERSEIEALFFDINTQHKSLVGEAWSPEGQLPQDLERAWQQLEQAEHAREIALRTELLRQQRLEQLNYKFNTKSVLRKGYLKEMIQVLSDPRYGSNLAQVDATVKKHEAISADILARKERFEDLSNMAAELVRERYHGAAAVQACSESVLSRWHALLALLERHRAALHALAALMALHRETDARLNTVRDMKAAFHSEEVGRHLSDVERLLQAHALQELQLGALDDAIRKLVRQGNAVEGPAQPKQQLAQQLTHLEDEYDSLVAAAKDRKARLEDARNLYQFLEDHDEEEGWVTDKQRICRAEVAAKDLRGVAALRLKHTALLHELKARDHVSLRLRAKGQSLIDAKHPKSGEIERRLTSLNTQWDILRELAANREKQLADATEVYQFYGDAHEAEAWIKEKRPLVASADCGSDEPAAAALLSRHKALHEEITAYDAELQQLCAHADKLAANGIHTLQLPTEVEAMPAMEEEEWVNETRLVPTEVWEEEPVERLEHRAVTEERSVPQVKALYAFTGQGISMAKGEVMFLISKTNPDWWSVRKADRSDGFVPANYVREIEPRVVPVQVRRPEKVRTVQRVKKTVLVKQVVPVRRAAAPRRASRTARPAPPPALSTTTAAIRESYDELLKLSGSRRLQLEDAIKLYSLFAECDDLDKWIRDKERVLTHDGDGDDVTTAKRKYEKFVTDLLAATPRLERIEAASAALAAARHGQAGRAAARTRQLQQQWERLQRLRAQREKSLQGASSVALFARTCDEAMDWMAEKERQLQADEAAPAADLRSVRALQRRHAQLERELEPLRDKVTTVTLLADNVKSQYPSETSSVEQRLSAISAMWARCQQEAEQRRRRLESASGHQIFCRSDATLQAWIKQTREQMSHEASAKDVATAEALRKEHQETRDDIDTHKDEFKEVIGLGKQLVANNPTLTDVAEKVKLLEEEQAAVEKEWRDKDAYLKQCVQLAAFNREADQIDAATGAHQAYLDYTHTGSTLDEVEALLKRHEELEARLAAQDERLPPFTAHARALQDIPHFAKEHIAARCAAVVAKRDAARQAAAERRRALQASLAHQQFIASTEELEAWIQDKTRTAKDQSYRDLANLERKLQKHEAFERELQANEKQLRNLESAGQALQKSDAARAEAVAARLQALGGAWAALVAASRDKGSKLRQARAQRAHKRSIEDAKARLAELERALASEETGADLRSCKRLLNKHQTLEQELVSWEQKAGGVAAAGRDLVSGGHFDSAGIEAQSAALLDAAAGLKPKVLERRRQLDTSLQLHKFAAEVQAELGWLSERLALSRGEPPASLGAAQAAAKRHAKLRADLALRQANRDKLLARGQELLDEKHPESDKIKELSATLESTYAEACAAAEARHGQLERALRGAQFEHEAREVEGWLADKAQALRSTDLGQDLHRATMILTKHKAVELELDTYAAIIAEMGRAAAAAAAPRLEQRHAALTHALHELQQLCAARRKALVGSVCRHEYLAESAELEEWIQEQYAAASSEDYGQDYEHLLLLRSKFEELRLRVESGAERFNQCEELAKKLLASESPYIADIERRQEALGEAWQRLVEQIGSRASRLHAAGEIHRFHRDVGELLARAADRRAALASAPLSAPSPRHDLRAVDAQLQVLQEEGTRLIKLYPGGNVEQIKMQQKALAEAWEALQAAAATRQEDERRAQQLHQFVTQVRDLTSWSTSLRGGMAGEARVRDAATAQALRADHDAVKAEIEARDDSFRQALQMADEMVQAGHPAAQEVEEKSEALLAERARLHAAWAARQVALDQLIDLHCFLRDCAQLRDLCAAQDAALSTEISPTLSVEEVQNLLKKHEAFEKLLVTQDEKLSTLNTHGDKLLQQNHVESQRIADELQAINARRKKIHAASAERGAALQKALAAAQFARDVADARAWVHGKLTTLQSDTTAGEVTSLEHKIKKLQKHQAFCAEVAANEASLRELRALCEELGQPGPRRQLAALSADWDRLLQATQEKGRGLEEAQDILEFNQNLDKIEAWIRDKEMMVGAHELGRDYEHCSALLRKLDDLDSDLQVDDTRVTTLCQLADKLLQQGPSQQAASVAARRDAFLGKWRALAGDLQKYRDDLAAALEIHAFNRDVEDTRERISLKAGAFSSRDVGACLEAAHELRRKHDARASEACAVRDKIKAMADHAAQLTEKYPEHAEEIKQQLSLLEADWAALEALAARRSALLDEALAHHKFEDSIKELEAWVSETVKRMASAEPVDSVAEAEAALHQHNETKAEIDGRQKALSALAAQAQAQSEQQQLADKLARLQALSATLDEAWTARHKQLKQAHQLQLLKEQLQQTEDWLAAKEAFLNNDDLGENLDAVETLIRKHAEFSKLLESQSGKVEELRQLAARVLAADGPAHAAAAPARARTDHLLARAEKLHESCAKRGAMLQQSKQLQQLMRDLTLEREWLALQMQHANDQNYRELSNIQSKIQKHAAFESELAANKGRVDDVANHGEELIEAKHYASEEIARHVEELEASWRALQAACKLRRARLQEAYQARVFLRGLDDFTAWLDDVEAQLLSEDHGKDLSSVTALLKRHARLAQAVAARADAAAQLADNARQLAADQHFMADDLLQQATSANDRYRQLQEPLQIRQDNLEDAALLYRWERDAGDELRWLEEREPAVMNEECGATLAEAQTLQKKHLELEAEINAREASVSAVCGRAAELVRRGHFAAAALEEQARRVTLAHRALATRAATRTARLAAHLTTLQLMSEIAEATEQLRGHRAALESADVGRDEASVHALATQLDARRRLLAAQQRALQPLQQQATALAQKENASAEELAAAAAAEAVLKEYEDMKLLCARREQRLDHSLKYFKFVEECLETTAWLGEQMSAAASEDYGLDVEHVETLQQAFDYFLQQIHANEGRIESVCEAGQALLEAGAGDAERVRARLEDLRGLWDDLNELAQARQEALAGARQVHEFDRSADETLAWVLEKEALLEGDAPRASELHARGRRLQALSADLAAVRTQHTRLADQAQQLGELFPDAQSHVSCKLQQVSAALQRVAERAAQQQQQLELATQLQAHFSTYHDLLAWTNETLARVTAPELARDVAGAERLVARHDDIHAEIKAKDDEFNALYADGEKLVSEGHFMSAEISERMAGLRARRELLARTWGLRAALYRTHLDALCFRRDADALDHWISTRVPLVRDGKLGESLAQVEEMINRHRDLEETIEAQRDRFEALKRITLVEAAFKQQQEEEEAARRESAARAAAERAEALRRQEVERLARERRRDTQAESPAVPPPAPVEAPAADSEAAQKADALPSAVKRAESMQVSSTKTPKRTPSFTTRRRTQSFRRHRHADVADLPPVEIEGFLERKQEAGCGGKRAAVRSWRQYYCVLCGQLLCFFRDEDDFHQAKAAAPPVAIANARCEPATDYTKRGAVLRVRLADGAEFLLACPSQPLMQEWVNKLAFHARLPPPLQLTPYAPDPAADLRRRLHENASSSSSESPTPEPARRARTQAEILQEHRSSQQRALPDRIVESTVLPSLPPRQTSEEATEVQLRNSEQQPSWGRSRFSNGRDINTEFIQSQRSADGAPPLPSTGPPSVPERGPKLPERGPSVPERGPSVPERNNTEKQSVTALVSRYQQQQQQQQRVDNNNARHTWSERERQNNNWQNVETTSHFYTASEIAYGGSGGGARPASVAGSGGSPALDNRPASRSSGESELSLGGHPKEKKDKKGVFGGLFSRKKRPQSHLN
ncbi:spectrin beta chain, non-erythrocytic 5 [Plutella xylostella]|uniref:spectrin beta chain, non-erythrocytic 5 n=1 Tax=Plutella xylostella TaxID=51655 RepID=UPI002032CF57|nr:spectrin beta chain, non-erythrocytic 5 [Plutella xylostella]